MFPQRISNRISSRIGKRIGVWSGVACLMAVVGLAPATPASAAAPSQKLTAVVTLKTITGTPVNTAGDVGVQTRCEVRSRNGNLYAQQWCETQAVWVTWYWGSTLIGYDDLLIDVFGPIMRDLGGWVHLQGGYATTSRPGNEVGIHILSSTNPVRIAVIGTDMARYCNSSGSPWSWSGWSRC